MDLDNLQDAWKDDQPNATPEISLEKQKKIHLPLEKIRKNMRMEFWVTISLFTLLILLLSIAKFENYRYQIYVISIIATMIVVSSFFFFKFFKFYKNLSKIDLNILENLKDLKFEFRLNEQYYLSYYIAYVPLIIPISMLMFEFDPFYKQFNGVEFVIGFTIFCSIFIVALYSSGKWGFNYFYGKYINKILVLLENLK